MIVEFGMEEKLEEVYIKPIYYIIYNYKHILIGPDAYPLESIKLHIAWFAGRDVAKHTAGGNIAWLTGSDVRASSNLAWSIRNVIGFNGIKWKEMHNIHVFYNKTIIYWWLMFR